MRVELKPKTVSKLRTLIGNFRNVGGGMVQSVINYILGIHCTLDTTNFDKNLDNTIVDCQKLADAVDELVLGDALPAGTESQTLRYNASDELVATDFHKVFSDGKWQGEEFYKKNITAAAKQYNNIVVDENGNFEKQLKNIAVLEEDILIDSNTLTAIADLEVDAMRGNVYHLEFRFILKRLIQVIPYDTFEASGFQFQFTNAGVYELEFLGGLNYQVDSIGPTNVLASYPRFNEFLSNYISDSNLEYQSSTEINIMVIHGTGIFRQSPENETINDNLSVLVAKVTDDEDYTLEKGSFVKITLKNED